MTWGLEQRNAVAQAIEYLQQERGPNDELVGRVLTGFAVTQIILDLQNDKLAKYQQLYGELPNENVSKLKEG